jgi:predicted nucleotidyltransferase
LIHRSRLRRGNERLIYLNARRRKKHAFRGAKTSLSKSIAVRNEIEAIRRFDAMLTHDIIADVARKAANEFSLTKMSYFGSYADGKATEESDLDVLAEFKESAVSILTIIRLRRFLQDELKKPVDVIHAPIPDGALIEIGKTVSVYERSRQNYSTKNHL